MILNQNTKSCSASSWPRSWTLAAAPARFRALRRLFQMLVAAASACLLYGATNALATDYYFSNCPTGGAGAQTNPYCLDPTGSYGKRSFEYVMDGSAPDVAAGDTIYLCAGACDGLGSGTYFLASIGTDLDGFTYVFDPQVSGTAQNPITIRPYCDADGCETVTLSGDTDGDGILDSTDLQGIVSNKTSAAANKSHYHWLCNPDGDASRNIIFEKIRSGQIFRITNGPNDWVIDGCVFRKSSDQVLWDGGSHAQATPTCDPGTNSKGYGMNVSNVTTTFTVKNSVFAHLCTFPLRITNNSGAQSILVENNEAFNTQAFNNDFNNRNITYRGNNLHDTMGLVVEDRMHDIVIEDNIISCLGDYKLWPFDTNEGSCLRGIDANNGDSGLGGTSYNITIRRNTVFATKESNTSSGGWFISGIRLSATCTTSAGCPMGDLDAGYLIENNLVWFSRGGADAVSDRAGIRVSTSEKVVIQNNTVYDAKSFALSLVNSPAVVRNNLLYLVDGGYPLRLVNASGATFSNNNLWDDGTDPVLVKSCGSASDETTCVSSARCSGIGNFGTDNVCGASIFVNVSGGIETWNLRLSPLDVANRGLAMTGPGIPTEDFELDPRGPLIDIGADQVGTLDTGPPDAPRNVRVQ